MTIDILKPEGFKNIVLQLVFMNYFIYPTRLRCLNTLKLIQLLKSVHDIIDVVSENVHGFASS